MIRVWDNELLTAKKELSPVTNGLIFWLDGQDELFHYANPTQDKKDYMYERVNGYKVDFSGALVAHTENGFIIGEYPSGASSGTYALVQALFPASFDSIRTVEYVSRSGSAYYCCGFAQSNQDYTFPNTSYYVARIPVSKFTQPMQLVGTINSGDFPSIYLNGEQYTTLQNRVIVLSGKPTITMRWPNSLGCVRLYSRELSAEEIVQNYLYEQSIGRIES